MSPPCFDGKTYMFFAANPHCFWESHEYVDSGLL